MKRNSPEHDTTRTQGRPMTITSPILRAQAHPVNSAHHAATNGGTRDG